MGIKTIELLTWQTVKQKVQRALTLASVQKLKGMLCGNFGNSNEKDGLHWPFFKAAMLLAHLRALSRQMPGSPPMEPLGLPSIAWHARAASKHLHSFQALAILRYRLLGPALERPELRMLSSSSLPLTGAGMNGALHGTTPWP